MTQYLLSTLASIVDAAAESKNTDYPDITAKLSEAFDLTVAKLQDKYFDKTKMLYTDYGITVSEADMILRNDYIPAIKEIRSRTGFGLKEAKDIADRFRGDKMMQVWDENIRDNIYVPRPS